MAVIVHVHKRKTNDAKIVNPQRGQALYDDKGQKVDEIEDIEKNALGWYVETRAGYRIKFDSSSGSNSKNWSNKKTGDAKPASDSERRERIQRVMSAAQVSEATARNMLEGEEWDVIDAVRELKHMKTLGFVLDGKTSFTEMSAWEAAVTKKFPKATFRSRGSNGGKAAFVGEKFVGYFDPPTTAQSWID